MVSTLDDTKRLSIATKLADMKALQNLLINNEQQLLQDCSDEDIRDRLQDMIEDDRKNLGVLDTVTVQYGVQGEPKETTQKVIEEVQKLMEGSELTLFEKVSQHELLKHKQTMAGLLIHKAVQVVVGSNDPQKIQEYFGQLYKDIKVHGTAEEQVVYPVVRPYYEHTQEIYDQTDEVMQMLEEIKPLAPSSSEFKAKVEQLRTAVRTHINQEEKDIFPKLRDNFSDEQQKQIATEFKTVKSQLQEEMAASLA